MSSQIPPNVQVVYVKEKSSGGCFKAIRQLLALAGLLIVCAIVYSAGQSSRNTPAASLPNSSGVTIPSVTPAAQVATAVPVTPTATPTPAPTRPPVHLAFSSAESGLQAVLGPVDIPTGAYRVTATTAGYFIASIETLDGECTTEGLGFFNLSAGQAADGAETTLKTSNCVALIVTYNARKPWTLTFELIQ